MSEVEVVLDAGPIPYLDMPLQGDPDLDHGLRHAGFEPSQTMYRLLELPLEAIVDVRGMARWQNMTPTYADKLRDGVEFPPIVVMPTPNGWTLLDGVNRTYAFWVLGRKTIRAYDLIEPKRRFD